MRIRGLRRFASISKPRRLSALLLALGLLAPGQALAVCAGESMLPGIEREQSEVWKTALADLASIPNSTGLFWKIEKDGIAPSWLLGTMHTPDTDLGALQPAVTEALSASERIVLELEGLNEESKVALAERILPEAALPDGETFDADFTSEQKAALGDMTAAVGMPYFTARRMQPWFIAITLAVPPCVQAAMLRGEAGVDDQLESSARDSGKPVIGLETIDEQVQALASLRDAIGPEALLEIIDVGPDGLADLFATMVQLYAEERPWLYMPLIRRLPKFERSADAFTLVERALLQDRNVRMHDRLLPILAEGSAFVGVGALHLPGADGLIELLRTSGYTVTRIE